MGNRFDWMVASASNDPDVQPAADYLYDLLNLSVMKIVRYGEREYGINLVWDEPGDSDPSIRIARQSSAGGPVQYGETFALGIRNGGYVRYKERENGINLVWSNEPVFEWRFEHPAGQSGDVATAAPLALLNTKHDDYLFYDPRRYGIDLKWLKDEGKYNDKPWYEDVGDFVVGLGSNVVNALKEAFGRLVVFQLLDMILTFVGIMIPKKIRLKVVILRDEAGRAILADENLAPTEEAADLERIEAAIQFLKDVLERQVNTTVVAADDDLVVTLDVAAPTAALEVGCGGEAWQEDFGEAGRFFRRHMARSGRGWLGGYGAPVTAFVVREVEGERGCSLGPVTDYVTVDRTAFDYHIEGSDDVGTPRREPPSTLAHEIGHACGLWHPADRPVKAWGNLMRRRVRDRGRILELHQRSVFRGSRHVTFF